MLNYIEKIDSKNDGKSTASFYNKVYLVQTVDGKEFKISVLHGQVPPKPIDFEANGKNYILYTYQTPDSVNIYDKAIYIKPN